MGIETAIIMGVSAAASAYSGKRNADKQKRAMQQQDATQREDLEFRKEMYADSQERYGEWKEMFWPVLEEIIAEADKNNTPDYEAIGADNRAAFATSMEATSRDLERRGLDISDPRYASTRHASRLAEAASLVGNRNAARAASANQRLMKLSSVYGLGSGLQSSAINSMQQSGALVSGGYQNMAANYGQRASQYGQASQQSWQAFGSILGSYDWGGALSQAFGGGGGAAPGAAAAAGYSTGGGVFYGGW